MSSSPFSLQHTIDTAVTLTIKTHSNYSDKNWKSLVLVYTYKGGKDVPFECPEKLTINNSILSLLGQSIASTNSFAYATDSKFLTERDDADPAKKAKHQNKVARFNSRAIHDIFTSAYKQIGAVYRSTSIGAVSPVSGNADPHFFVIFPFSLLLIDETKFDMRGITQGDRAAQNVELLFMDGTVKSIEKVHSDDATYSATLSEEKHTNAIDLFFALIKGMSAHPFKFFFVHPYIFDYVFAAGRPIDKLLIKDARNLILWNNMYHIGMCGFFMLYEKIFETIKANNLFHKLITRTPTSTTATNYNTFSEALAEAFVELHEFGMAHRSKYFDRCYRILFAILMNHSVDTLKKTPVTQSQQTTSANLPEEYNYLTTTFESYYAVFKFVNSPVV